MVGLLVFLVNDDIISHRIGLVYLLQHIPGPGKEEMLLIFHWISQFFQICVNL